MAPAGAALDSPALEYHGQRFFFNSTLAVIALMQRPLWREDGFVSVRVRARVRVTLRLAVCCQSVRLGAKFLESHGQRFFQLSPCNHSPYATSSLTTGWVCLTWTGFALVKCMYRTCGISLHGYGECHFLPGSGQSEKKVIIWNKEPLMGFEMCLWEQSHICM
jgi:hypothetical protein